MKRRRLHDLALTFSSLLLCSILMLPLGSAFTVPHRPAQGSGVVMRCNDLKMRKVSNFRFWRNKAKPHKDPTVSSSDAAEWSASTSSSAVSDTAHAAGDRGDTEPLLLNLPEQIASVAHFSLRECVFAIVAYLAIGAIAYTRIFERWSLIDALYFSVASFSTVGKHTHTYLLL
jgi:hypothetical protein